MKLTRRRFFTLAGGTAAAGAGLGAYAFLYEPRFRLVTTHYDVTSPAWGKRPPLKIAALTDLHFCEPWMPPSRAAKIVARTNALKPDLIVMLGDYAPGLDNFRSGIVPLDNWSAELAKLKAPLGVHAVLGNHDWWTDGPAYGEAIKASGAQLYRNEVHEIGTGEQSFYISGTDSAMAEYGRNGRHLDRSDIDAVYRALPADKPAIHLMHEPDLFTKIRKPIFLAFAGHTHGGQVRLPFIGRPVIPSDYCQRFAYGHITEGDKQLIVSGGLGVSMAPVRFAVPPEIVTVTLRGAVS